MHGTDAEKTDNVSGEQLVFVPAEMKQFAVFDVVIIFAQTVGKHEQTGMLRMQHLQRYSGKRKKPAFDSGRNRR